MPKDVNGKLKPLKAEKEIQLQEAAKNLIQKTQNGDLKWKRVEDKKFPTEAFGAEVFIEKDPAKTQMNSDYVFSVKREENPDPKRFRIKKTENFEDIGWGLYLEAKQSREPEKSWIDGWIEKASS